jgi:TrmH family RNA methyltransferase
MRVLTSREDRELRALRRRGGREDAGRFLAEGVRVVEDLLASPIPVHWAAVASSLEDGERGRRLIEAFDRRSIPLRVLPDADFRRVADTEHPQGVLAVASVPTSDLPDLIPGAGRCVVLVLDAVQDPGNFGTLSRSAEALGASGLIALPGTVDPWNAKAVRAAVGSTFRLPIVAAQWEAAARWLRGEGFRILGAAVGGGPVPADLDRVALVVGNEGAGLSPEVSAGVDALVGIPLRGRAESLNVNAAAAILLHELTR